MSSEASSHNAGTTSPLVLHTKSYSRVQSKVIWGAGTVLYGPKSQLRERCFGTGMAPSDRRKRSTGLWNCCGGLTGERRSCVHRYPYGSNDLWEIERCSLRSGYWAGVASSVMLELSGFQAQKKTSVDVFFCGFGGPGSFELGGLSPGL